MLYNILFVLHYYFFIPKQNTIKEKQNTLQIISNWFAKVKQNTIKEKQNTNKNSVSDEDEDEDEKAIYFRFKSVLLRIPYNSKEHE